MSHRDIPFDNRNIFLDDPVCTLRNSVGRTSIRLDYPRSPYKEGLLLDSLRDNRNNQIQGSICIGTLRYLSKERYLFCKCRFQRTWDIDFGVHIYLYPLFCQPCQQLYNPFHIQKKTVVHRLHSLLPICPSIAVISALSASRWLM